MLWRAARHMTPRDERCYTDGDNKADTELVDDVIRAAGIASERSENGLDKEIVAAVENGGGPQTIRA